MNNWDVSRLPLSASLIDNRLLTTLDDMSSLEHNLFNTSNTAYRTLIVRNTAKASESILAQLVYGELNEGISQSPILPYEIPLDLKNKLPNSYANITWYEVSRNKLSHEILLFGYSPLEK